MVKYLALKTKNLNSEDPNKLTLLMKYLITKNMGMAEFLLSKGASINFQNRDGNTALHICLLNNELSGVDFLLKKGANPHYFNRFGVDCCDIAHQNKVMQFTELLNCPHSKNKLPVKVEEIKRVVPPPSKPKKQEPQVSRLVPLSTGPITVVDDISQIEKNFSFEREYKLN